MASNRLPCLHTNRYPNYIIFTYAFAFSSSNAAPCYTASYASEPFTVDFSESNAKQAKCQKD